jgi:hypothetical protein
VDLTQLYAPKPAAKISEAADLIEKAVRLLDTAGDRFVIAEIEAIPATEHINSDTVKALRALAERLDS